MLSLLGSVLVWWSVFVQVRQWRTAPIRHAPRRRVIAPSRTIRRAQQRFAARLRRAGAPEALVATIATRAWVEPLDGSPFRQRAPWRTPRKAERGELLVIDVETTNLGDGRVGPGYQCPLLLGWLHVLGANNPTTASVLEEGLAYPDDLPARDPQAFARLAAYVESHEPRRAAWASKPGETRPTITLMPLSEFLDTRLFKLCYRRRVALVGFNLGFDLAALALRVGAARPKHRGAFSLSFWGAPAMPSRRKRRSTRGSREWDDGPGRPRLRVQRLDRHGSLIYWTRPARGTGSYDRGVPWPGCFVDTHTLAYALCGEDLSLEGACERFGVTCEKVECTFGMLDNGLIDHVRGDVAATARLYIALNRLAQRWGTRADGRPVVLDPGRLHSPAGLADALLDALGVTPMHLRFHGGVLSRRDVLASGMCATYGGRAEVRVLRQAVPVVPIDWGAQYSTISVLLGVGRYWRARRFVAEDATGLALELLRPEELCERLFRPSTWRRLGITLVEVAPDGEPWPRRLYDPETGEWRSSVGPLTYPDATATLWYAWPDVAAAALTSGRLPHIVRAVRLVPRGIAKGLRPVRLGPGRATLDLGAGGDQFRALVAARRDAEHTTGLGPLAGGYKVAASALSHGLPSRFDRDRYAHPKPGVRRRVSAQPGIEAVTRLRRLEIAGPFNFAPLATCVTAGGRLLLGMLEYGLAAAGARIPWAYADTDGAGVLATPHGGLVACAGGSERLDDGTPAVHAVSFDVLRRILDAFASLNTFGRGSPWRIEHDALDEPLHAYVVGSKRYAVFRERPGGIALVKVSEHGISGVLADPYQGERGPTGARRLAEEWWAHLLDPEHHPEPAWASLPALEPAVAGTPRLADQAGTQPFAFYYRARPPLLRASHDGEVLVPYEPEPARWHALRSTRRGEPVHARVARNLSDLPGPGEVLIGSLGDELARYRRTRRPVGYDAHGDSDEEPGLLDPCVLNARAVVSGPARRALIGREAFDEPEHGTQRLRTVAYATCQGCGTPLGEGETVWCRRCAHRTGLWRARVRDAHRPRCAEDGCDEVVSRRGALCPTHRRARRRAADRVRHYQEKLARVGPTYVLCAENGCGRSILGPGAQDAARRDRWQASDGAWLCPQHAPARELRTCTRCGKPADPITGLCGGCARVREEKRPAAAATSTTRTRRTSS